MTCTSASFSMLRELLARLVAGPRFERGRLRFVRVASGRLEPAEMDELEQRLGVPVITGPRVERGGNDRAAGVAARAARARLGRAAGRLRDPAGRRGGARRRAGRGRRGRRCAGRRCSTATSTIPSSMRRASSTAGSGWATSGASTTPASSISSVASRSRSTAAATRSRRPSGRGAARVSGRRRRRRVPGSASAAWARRWSPRSCCSPGAAVDERRSCSARARCARCQPRPAPTLVRRRAAAHRGGKLRRADLPAWVGHDAGGGAPAMRRAGAARRPTEMALAALWASVLRVPGGAGAGRLLHARRRLAARRAAARRRCAPRSASSCRSTRCSPTPVRLPAWPGASRRNGPGRSTRRPSDRRFRAAAQALRCRCRHPASRLVSAPPRSGQCRVPRGAVVAHRWPARRRRAAGRARRGRRAAADAAHALRHGRRRAAPGRRRRGRGPALDVVDLSAAGGDPERRSHAPCATSPRCRSTSPRRRRFAWRCSSSAPRRFALLRVWHHIVGRRPFRGAAAARALDAYAAAMEGQTVAAAAAGGRLCRFRRLAGDRADSGPGRAESLDVLEAAPRRPADARPSDRLPAAARAELSRRTSSRDRFRGESPPRSSRSAAQRGRDAVRGVSRGFRGADVSAVRRRRTSRSAPRWPAARRPSSRRSSVSSPTRWSSAPTLPASRRPGGPAPHARPRAGNAAHQRPAVRELVDALGMPRDPSRNPLFQVAFALRERDAVDLRFAGRPRPARPRPASGARSSTSRWRSSTAPTGVVALLGVLRGPVRARDDRADGAAVRDARRVDGRRAGLVRWRPCRSWTRRRASGSSSTASDAPGRAFPAASTMHRRFAERSPRRPRAPAIASARLRGARLYGEPACAGAARRGAPDPGDVRRGIARRRRPTSPSRCSRCSRRAAPTCRSIPELPAERLAYMLADAARRATRRRRDGREPARAARRRRRLPAARRRRASPRTPRRAGDRRGHPTIPPT